MKFTGNKEAVILFLGDVSFWAIALWFTLFIRYGEVPKGGVLTSHIGAFWIIFIVWTVVFFISSLYSKQTIISRSKLPSILFNTQIVNSFIAVLFFYFIPYFGITPKINLFIDLVLSFFLVLVWRLYIVNYLLRGKKISVLIVGEGEEIKEITRAIQQNPRNRMKLDCIKSGAGLREEIEKRSPHMVILNFRSQEIRKFSPELHTLLFSKIIFVDVHDVYESLFGRVALSYVDDNWFLEHINVEYQAFYSLIKRMMDILVSVILGILSLVIYPFIWIFIKFEDQGHIFINQERIGEGGRLINITKFRTMTGKDIGDDVLDTKQKITRVGAFLRRTRIDELPQLWNVIRGDLSLIGPRPELPELNDFYNKRISYYSLRHIIRPGLSGWAQIYHDKHPHHGSDVEATREKLSYDFYYIKNRGIVTDLKIALKTIRTLFSCIGV